MERVEKPRIVPTIVPTRIVNPPEQTLSFNEDDIPIQLSRDFNVSNLSSKAQMPGYLSPALNNTFK